MHFQVAATGLAVAGARTARGNSPVLEIISPGWGLVTAARTLPWTAVPLPAAAPAEGAPLLLGRTPKLNKAKGSPT